jgi:hypothetical protein
MLHLEPTHKAISPMYNKELFLKKKEFISKITKETWACSIPEVVECKALRSTPSTAKKIDPSICCLQEMHFEGKYKHELIVNIWTEIF